MNGILAEIVDYKREFVAVCRKKLPLKDLEQMLAESEDARDFVGALSGNGCSLIAEIKTASPSAGIIRHDVNVEDVARIYMENGAACISVVTDERYFMGSLERLKRIRKLTELPLLRKDFIIDVYQIFEARYAGADAVLFIVACLNDTELLEFIEIASLLDMDCLIEVHDEIEMSRIGSLGARLIGINNRDLKTFETDITTTGRLAHCAPDNAVIVSESGIRTVQDVREVYQMGAHAVLVGEALMREQDIACKVKEFSQVVANKNIYN